MVLFARRVWEKYYFCGVVDGARGVHLALSEVSPYASLLSKLGHGNRLFEGGTEAFILCFTLGSECVTLLFCFCSAMEKTSDGLLIADSC